MNAIRITKRIDSDMLHVPELRPLIGREVEIIVLHPAAPERISASEFWKQRTVDELAAAQGVSGPVPFECLRGDWSDSDFDGFDEAVNAWRSATRPSGSD